jgi:hypothetical protein
LVVAVSVVPERASAGPITPSLGTAPLPIAEDFETFAEGSYSILDGNGVKMAEAFLGQSVSGGGSTHETVSGSPTNPLTLAVPGTDNGVGVILFFSTVSFGLTGSTDFADLGKGLVSILFDMDQTTFGLTIGGAQPEGGGTATFDFYARDGVLIDTVVLEFPPVSFPGLLDYTFTSSGPAFAGITIANTDVEGVNYDDFRHAVPEPSTLLLVGSGLLAMAGLTRARKSGS